VKAVITHPWDVPPAEAVAIQRDLRRSIVPEFPPRKVEIVAGVDMSVRGQEARAAVVALSYPELTPLEQATAEVPITMPYIPGLLAFREGPAVLAACARLALEPDLLVFDGHGLAHPRRFGIACHMGVLLDRPSIGCAKSRLCGEHDEPPVEAGSHTLLRDGGEVIGAVVRTRSGVRPVFVSIGHRVDLDAATQYILNCCRGYRLPEPTRLAHQAAGGAQVATGPQQLSLFDL
jgi:deoxyribonuclease V